MWTSYPESRARRSTCSATQRSVPCRLSRNGETTAMQGLSAMASCGGVFPSLEIRLRLKFRQAEKDSHQQPEIRIQDKVLIAGQAAVGVGEQQQEREPKDPEGDGKDRGATRTPNHAPAGADQRKRPGDPEQGTQHPQLKKYGPVAALHGDFGARLPEDSRD